MSIDSLDPGGEGRLESSFDKANKKTKNIKPVRLTGRPDRDKVIGDEEITDLKIDINTQTADEFIGGL